MLLGVFVTFKAVPWVGVLERWLAGRDCVCTGWGLEFKSPTPTYKPGVAMWACDPSVEGWRQADPESSLDNL